MFSVNGKAAVLGLLGLCAACGVSTDDQAVELAPASDAKPGTTKESVEWQPQDAPSIFTSDLTYDIDDLPKEGAAATAPWAGSYWPVYQDSINIKWDGASSDPASTKYAKAYNVSGVEDAVSRMRGVLYGKSRKACTQSSECDSSIGESCAKREGQSGGYCIPTWWGICHAWAPASILVAEPKYPVTVNGVTFKVNDIRALVTLAHDDVEEKFVSLRCDADDGKGKIEYDEFGRPKDGSCSDTNAGTLHILMTNYLGKKNQSFVMDRTFDDEVWNQPLRGFRVTQFKEVTSAEANTLVGVGPQGGTTTNLSATVAKDAWQHFAALAVTAGQTLKVVMQGTGDGDLYVKLGAQANAGIYDCRPYGSSSDETCELTVPTGQTQAFVSVHGYSQSQVTLAVTTGTPAAAYKFNSNAKRFFEVHTELDYISESATTTDGPTSPNIAQYTHTDNLAYVLEADVDGRILGGEWLGESKKHHPDFLWLPVRVARQSVAEGKVTYANVMNLLNQSLVPPGGGGTGETKVVNESGTVTKGQWKVFGPYSVGAGKTLTANMTGSGDADLYVRKGAAPSATAYDCRPYASNSTETCTVSGAGDFYVAVNGYATSSAFTLKITYTTGGGGSGGGGGGTTSHLNVSGSLSQGQFAYHSVNVVAGQKIVVRTVAPNDVDLYLLMDGKPTTASYVARGYTASGNETLTYTSTATGVLWIGVHGYAASSYALTTANN
jgi:hypothetical protein